MKNDAQTRHEVGKAPASMGRYLAELGRTDVRILDFGCGWGGETLWLASQVREVTGVDVEPSSIDQAKRALADCPVSNCSFAVCHDTIPFEDRTFDAVFSTDTFEHVMDLEAAFREIHRVLKPGGLLVTRFGPLFYSPYGYHLRWACQVPYAHTVFGLSPVLRLRNERAGTTLRADSWQDTGLNCRTFEEFRQATIRSGLKPERFDRIPVKGLRRLAGLPGIGKYFTFGVDCVARRMD